MPASHVIVCALRILIMMQSLQDFLEDVAPLISMQLGAPTLDGLSMLFDQYIDMLIKAVPSPGDDEDGGAENGDDKKVSDRVEFTWASN